MKLAFEAFQAGNTNSAIQICSQIINQNKENVPQALLNRASVFQTVGKYQNSLQDIRLYLNYQKPRVEGYIILTNNLLKLKSVLNQSDRNLLQRGKDQFPYHKKYLDALKNLYEIQITENEQEYLDKIFQKILSVPTLRSYMTEQSFLTKVEKMVTNPSLAAALIKMDARLAEVQEIILMADN